MHRIPVATVLATLVFAVPAALYSVYLWRFVGPGPLVMALVVIPPAWRYFVIHQGRPCARRGGLAGAAFTLLILMPAPIAVMAVHTLRKPNESGLAGLFEMVIAMWFLVVIPVLMLLGAAIAAWLAWHQGRTFDAADAQPAPASPVAARARLSEMRSALRSGAIGGALTGVLATPLGVLEALGTLSDPEGVPVDVLSELLWLLIPVTAILGLTSTRPWAKFVGGLLAVFAASRSLGAAVTLLSLVLPKPYSGQTDLYILFTGAWLLMIPAGAALGVMAAALWSRSPSAYGNAASRAGSATSHQFEQAS